MKNKLHTRICKRGEIWYAALGIPQYPGEQSGTRPVLIIQNDIGNKFSPTVIIAPLTGRQPMKTMPVHIEISGVSKKSIILLEQIRVISKERLIDEKPVSSLTESDMKKVDEAISVSLGLEKSIQKNKKEVSCRFSETQNGMDMKLKFNQKEEIVIKLNNSKILSLYYFLNKILIKKKEAK